MDKTGASVIAAFTNISDAERAVRELQEAGFPAQEVRLVANDQDHMSTSSRTDSTWPSTLESQPEKKGGVMNFFASLFGFDDEDTTTRRDSKLELQHESRQYFTDTYQQGRHLVVVYSSSDRMQAVNILTRCGGVVEDKASMLYEQELLKSNQLGATGTNRRVMQLNEEELVANKETVQTGELTLHKEVITETRTIEVPVTREELVIERRTLNGAEAAAFDGSISARGIGETEEIRIPVSEERVTIDKKVVPREEIRVSKQKVERIEEVSEDVRHEEVQIEREGDVAMRGDSLEIDADDSPEVRRQKAQRRKDLENKPSGRPYL